MNVMLLWRKNVLEVQRDKVGTSAPANAKCVNLKVKGIVHQTENDGVIYTHNSVLYL